MRSIYTLARSSRKFTRITNGSGLLKSNLEDKRCRSITGYTYAYFGLVTGWNLQSKSVHLSKVALEIPGATKAPSIIRRSRR